jgi:hypothetical protein
MDSLFNVAQKMIYIKDMTNVLNFDKINEEFDKLTYTQNIGNIISEDKLFFDKDCFTMDKKLIEKECEKYLNNTNTISEYYTNLRVTNSWGNVTKGGQEHHDHIHPFSVVSGVIFLDNNVDNFNLYVEGYMPQIPYFMTNGLSYVALKNLFTDFQINTNEHNNLKNHMVLFLSNSHHFVEKTMPNRPDRRTISFNTFWVGPTGLKHDPLGSTIFS